MASNLRAARDMALAAQPIDRNVTTPSRPWRRAVTSPPVLAWVAHLIVVLPTAAVTVALTPDRDDDRQRFSQPGRYLISPLSTWDGGWYVRIARDGYDQVQESAAFWPLYPLLIDLGQTITGWSYESAGVLLSNLLFLGALAALFRLVRTSYGSAIASRAVWLAALSPLAFFFSTVYTESLFLLLTVGALTLANSGRWTSAALVAALATLTRNSGVLILLPLGVMLIQQRGCRPRLWWTRAVQLIAASLTPGAFALHLDRVWGDPLLTVHVQERWGRVQAMPWETLTEAVHRQHRIYATGRHFCEARLSVESFHQCRAALDLKGRGLADDLSFALVAGCLVLMPYAVWRLLSRDSIYLVTGFVVPLFGPTTYDPLASMARYLIVLFPLYIALAILLRWRPLFAITIALSALAMSGLTAMFAQRYFVA